MVAKSFQSYAIVSEVYTANGRQYVKVQNPKNGSTKQVRWYSEDEYNKMYGIAEPQSIPFKTQKIVLGFINDYITIFKNGGMDENNEYFKYSPARYCRLWGWYFPSDIDLPEDLPADCNPMRLEWAQVGNDDEKLKTDAEIHENIDALLWPEHPSQYQGAVGERIDRNIVVIRNYKLETNYGTSNMMTFEDEQGNIYLWTTTAKDWPEGTKHRIRGTVKSHNLYHNIHQSVLTRVAEVR